MTGKRTVAERVVEGILAASPATPTGRAKLRALTRARRLLVRAGDPVIRRRVGAAELELPLSHELPFYLQDHPAYGANLARLAAVLDGPVVDIGANVGDGAAQIRELTDVPILCIEGEERFFALLERNARRLDPAPELERAFVAAGEPVRGRVESAGGTARIVAGAGPELPSRPLGAVLDDHPAFAAPRLLKLDTDGMDVPIVLAELDLLKRLRPVLFLEYDPHLGAEPGVFAALRTIGYVRALVWENTGESAGELFLADDGAVAALHERYRGHGGARYADVAVFHAVDAAALMSINI